ncbi:MAG: hypothetical protein E5V25_02845 [Mesorhizobium sp.]|nr:MAG: hypothetical protein E5V25_02845 [Mesorhizobium sp.]TIX83118.1 MAG: hypothetical protein E5V21_07470 [Mesorhizobium sp.]
MLNPKGAVIWWHTIRTDAATAGEAVTRMQAFLATHVLPFRACYACYNVSDAARQGDGGGRRLGAARPTTALAIQLSPRRGGRDAGRGRPHGLPRMVVATID